MQDCIPSGGSNIKNFLGGGGGEKGAEENFRGQKHEKMVKF